jgi:hypothetical protein
VAYASCGQSGSFQSLVLEGYAFSLAHHDDCDEERQTNLKMIGGYSSEREAEQQELANISIRILRHA